MLRPDIHAPTGQTEYSFSSSTNQAIPTRCGWSGDFYHFAQHLIYDGDANGNSGMAVIPTAYDTFKDNVLRKFTCMLIGTQYQLTAPTQPVQGTEE